MSGVLVVMSLLAVAQFARSVVLVRRCSRAYVDGYDDGYADGYEDGCEHGYEDGYDEGRDIAAGSEVPF